MSPKICPQCGIEFSDPRHPTRKYCTKRCWHLNAEKNRTKTCKLCGRTFVEKKKTNSIYCSTTCSKLATIEKICKCETCGKDFHQSPNGRRRFCSNSCNPKYVPRNGRQHIIDPSKHSKFVCKQCHKVFIEWTYRKPTFCSAHCRSIYAAHQPKPSECKPENFLSLICETCGKSYTVHKIYNTGKRRSRFCSISCRAEWTSFARRGPGNVNWKGGFNEYGQNWNSQARKVRKRDKHICQVCKTKPTRTLDVHHVIPLATFKGDWESANELKNLITLCRKCHFKVEKKIIPCPPVSEQ